MNEPTARSAASLLESPGAPAPSRVGLASSLSRPARVAALRAVMGVPDARARPLSGAIRDVARRQFELHVVPRIARTWPGLFEDPFYDKLRIGACDLYASAPYTALFCSPRRPLPIQLVTSVGDRLPLGGEAMSRLGAVAMHAIGRGSLAGAHRRIALVAAFIVVVDHVFDHVLREPAELRATRLIGVMDGTLPADGPELALVRSLVIGMGAGLEGRDEVVFDEAMTRVRDWIDAEVKAMLGVVDPTGLGHRLAGVEGTIDGLLFPVARYATPDVRAWMIDVSMFVQVMDDWLDFELDHASDRPTPVTTGVWALADVERTWARTLTGIDAVARASGIRSPAMRSLVRGGYVLMMHDVMEAMASRPNE